MASARRTHHHPHVHNIRAHDKAETGRDEVTEMTMHLETDRLVINRLTKDDLNALAAIEADQQVRRYIDGKVMSRAQTADYIDMILASYADNGYGRFAVRMKADGQLAGLCGFIDEDYGIDFGYRYARACWGHGIATEAGRAVLDYGLKELALPEVVGIVIREHTASIAVLEKLELQFVENTEYMGFPIVKYVKSRP